MILADTITVKPLKGEAEEATEVRGSHLLNELNDFHCKRTMFHYYCLPILKSTAVKTSAQKVACTGADRDPPHLRLQ